MEEYDFVIIGGGCAGYPAAVYASRYNLKTLVIAKQRGGLITSTNEVENYPGFNSISGFDLAMKLEEQVIYNNVEIRDETVSNIKKEGNYYLISVAGENAIKTKTLLIATGTKHRHLGLASEEEFKGKGVSFCATCDGMFYRNKVVGVVGGGDSAVKDALVLAQNSSKVYMFVRSYIKAEPANVKQLEKFENVEVITGVNLKEIKGDDSGVTSVLLDNNQEIELTGLFMAIGLIPQSDLAKNLGAEINESGEIVVDNKSRTNLKGVFAAGDVTNNGWKQAIIASAQGSMAAHSAYEYIVQNKFE